LIDSRRLYLSFHPINVVRMANVKEVEFKPFTDQKYVHTALPMNDIL